MSKQDPLPEGYIQAHESIQTQASEMAWKIGNHLSEVVNAICDVFGNAQPESVYFPGAEQGDIGVPRISGGNPSPTAERRERVIHYVYFSYNCGHPDIQTSEFDFGDAIPLDYMYMTLDEVKADVQRQLDADEQVEAATALKLKNISDKKKKTIESAKSKLTKAEKKALGL